MNNVELTDEQAQFIDMLCKAEYTLSNIPDSIYPTNEEGWIKPNNIKFLIKDGIPTGYVFEDGSQYATLRFISEYLKLSWEHIERPLLKYVWDNLNKNS